MKNYPLTNAGFHLLVDDMMKITSAIVQDGHGTKELGCLGDQREQELLLMLGRMKEIVQQNPELEELISLGELEKMVNDILDGFNGSKSENTKVL